MTDECQVGAQWDTTKKSWNCSPHSPNAEKRDICFFESAKKVFFANPLKVSKFHFKLWFHCNHISSRESHRFRSISSSHLLTSTNFSSCVFTVNNLRWCKLYNNLLFILKTNDQFSEPAALLVLENVNQISTTSDNSCAFVIGMYM